MIFRITRFLLNKSPTAAEVLKAKQWKANVFKDPVKIKPSTRLVGIPVQPRWKEMTVYLCTEIRKKVQNSIPNGVFYRKVTENNIDFIQKVCEEYDDYEIVEEILDRGQIEQVIMMLEDELELIDLMKEWKPWEVSRKNLTDAKNDILNGEDFQIPKGVNRIPEEEMTWKTTKGIRTIEELEWTPEQLKELGELQQKQIEESAKNPRY